MSTGADGPAAIGPSTPPQDRSVARVLVAVVLLFGAALVLVQVQLRLDPKLSLIDSLLAFGAVQAAILGLAVLTARLTRQPLREVGFVLRGPVPATLLFSGVLVLAFVIVQIYPGFLVHFSRNPPQTSLVFGFALFSAPLAALGQEAAFRGYIFRTLTRVLRLPVAMAISSTCFAVYATNLLALPSLGEVGGGEYLFSTTVTNLVLGLVLALLFYKSRWSLLAPVAVRTGLLWATTLMPIVAAFPDWQTSFAALLLAYGVMLAIVAFGIREPRLQAHHYLGEKIGPRRLRFRERARNRREVRGAVGVVGVVALAFVVTTQALPAVLGTSQPLLAIATGSMVPTLHRGTLVVVVHASPGSIGVGTIIAFHVSCLPAPTVHRVYRILQGGSSPIYQTKGDANPSPDPCPVPYADVLGKVVAIVPYLGLLVLDPLLLGAVVGLIIVAALLVPRRDPWRSH